LGIPSNADAKQIKQAYWKKAEQHHPDKGGDEGVFERISDAYEVLSDPDKRRYYDEHQTMEGFKDDKEIARERICTVVGAIIHHGSFMADYTDLIRRVREEINQASIEINHEISNCNNLIKRYDSILGRLNNAEFINAFVVESKARIEEKKQNLLKDLVIQDAMHDMIEKSAYSVDIDTEKLSGKPSKESD
jgi:hypothetical protein